MQSALPRIWTRVAVPISYDNNHYTTGTSNDATNNNVFFFYSDLKIVYYSNY